MQEGDEGERAALMGVDFGLLAAALCLQAGNRLMKATMAMDLCLIHDKQVVAAATCHAFRSRILVNRRLSPLWLSGRASA